MLSDMVGDNLQSNYLWVPCAPTSLEEEEVDLPGAFLGDPPSCEQ